MKSHTRTRVLFSSEFKEAVDRLQDKEKEIDSLVRRADRIKTNRRKASMRTATAVDERRDEVEEDSPEETTLTCGATICARNQDGACRLAHIVFGEGHIVLDEGGRCMNFFTN